MRKVKEIEIGTLKIGTDTSYRVEKEEIEGLGVAMFKSRRNFEKAFDEPCYAGNDTPEASPWTKSDLIELTGNHHRAARLFDMLNGQEPHEMLREIEDMASISTEELKEREPYNLNDLIEWEKEDPGSLLAAYREMVDEHSLDEKVALMDEMEHVLYIGGFTFREVMLAARTDEFNPNHIYIKIDPVRRFQSSDILINAFDLERSLIDYDELLRFLNHGKHGFAKIWR